MSGSLTLQRISEDFSKSARSRKPDRRKRTPPVSIRFSDDERDLLSPFAGNLPLSTYVRAYVVKAHEGKKPRRRQVSKADPKLAAQLLSALGRSELAPLLRDALSAVDAGKLNLDWRIEADLRVACAEISAVRRELMKALGLRSDISP